MRQQTEQASQAEPATPNITRRAQGFGARLRQQLFRHTDPLIFAIVATLLFALVGYTLWSVLYPQLPVHPTYTIAAGGKSGESFLLAIALQQAMQDRYPQITIAVSETNGTVQSLEALRTGQAQFATPQADLVAQDLTPASSLRAVAALYVDHFQLASLQQRYRGLWRTRRRAA